MTMLRTGGGGGGADFAQQYYDPDDLLAGGWYLEDPYCGHGHAAAVGPFAADVSAAVTVTDHCWPQGGRDKSDKSSEVGAGASAAAAAAAAVASRGGTGDAASRRRRRLAANARERRRMNGLNEAFDRLRGVVPAAANDERKLSKFETLQMAQTYIVALHELLGLRRVHADDEAATVQEGGGRCCQDGHDDRWSGARARRDRETLPAAVERGPATWGL